MCELLARVHRERALRGDRLVERLATRLAELLFVVFLVEDTRTRRHPLYATLVDHATAATAATAVVVGDTSFVGDRHRFKSSMRVTPTPRGFAEARSGI